MTDEQEPMLVHEITIRSALRQGDGAELMSVVLPAEASLTELLGMLDYARFMAWRERQGFTNMEDER